MEDTKALVSERDETQSHLAQLDAFSAKAWNLVAALRPGATLNPFDPYVEAVDRATAIDLRRSETQRKLDDLDRRIFAASWSGGPNAR